jgi:uncharacterized membrane protein HdeD (DUF308 family)
MGIALVILGIVAVGSALFMTLTTVLIFGVLLIMGAIFQIVAAIWGRNWKGFILHLLMGVLYFVAGVFMIDNPLEAASALTLLIAACLIGSGILRIVFSALQRFEGWGWLILNGVVALVLGASIWKQWPLSGLWVIGLFVGIEMLFSGVSWIMLGLSVRRGQQAKFPDILGVGPRHAV